MHDQRDVRAVIANIGIGSDIVAFIRTTSPKSQHTIQHINNRRINK